MTDQNPRPKSRDLFLSADEVATQIFENRPELEVTGQEPDRLAVTDHAGSKLVSLFHRNSGNTPPARTHSEQLWDVLVHAFQERNVAALVDYSQQVHLDAETNFPRSSAVNSPDIGYRVSRKLSQLPVGVELLKGKPSVRTDDEILQSIRLIIGEQERERKAIELEGERELNLQKLPPSEPPPVEVPIPAPVVETVSHETVFHRTRLRLKHTLRKDIVLAVSLSVSCALALVVFIDSSPSTAVSVASIFLLFMLWRLSIKEYALYRARKMEDI